MKYFTLLLLSVLLAGCAATRISVDKEFWTKNKNDKIGIVITKKPEGGAFKTGSQGLLDIAINNAMASTLNKYLKTVDVNDIKSIKDTFKTKFESAGFSSIKFIDEELNYDSLSVSGLSDKKFSKKDFKAFRDKYGLDYLVVLSVAKYGTVREYYGFLPLGSPSAYFQVNGMMINLTNNEYAWYREMTEGESTVEIKGDWDQEPDYPNLTNAIKDAIKKSRHIVTEDFFSLGIPQGNKL